jgi:fatty-acyl-CoA synthase
MTPSDAPLTLISALTRLRRGPGRGFRFVSATGEERYYAYEELEAEARRRAAHLAAAGLEKGDRLALVIAEGDEFVLSFLGACVAGIVPVPLHARATFKGLEGYAETLAHIVSAAGARALLTTRATQPFTAPALEKDCGLERVLVTEELFAGATPAFVAPTITPEDLCFLQFTSGSTSQPKGVVVTHANLVANATAFLGPAGLDRNDQDVGVSWLPLFHDMGLIGFVLGSLICDIPVVLLPTSTFARGPRIWLETIHKHRGTITYAPNFAYALATKRLKDRDVAELDLSCLRVAGCGAEPIHAQTMRDFAARLAPAGFDARALLPSYGMAEATLAITFHPRGTPLVTDTVDGTAMKRGEAQRVAAGTSGALELVGCGVPFPGHELRIVDSETGAALGERQVGQVVARGPSVTSEYFRNPEATALGWRDGWLQTGDLGYLADGALYLCGRLKDLIILHGANFHPQDLEWAVQDLEGVRRGNVVAFSVQRDGAERLVVAVEANSSDAERLRKLVPERLYDAAGVATSHVAVVGVGTLPKTSSGKVQRLKTRQLFDAGLLVEHGSPRVAETAETSQ